ncbi:molybdopterin cofactor synthesis protein A, putative [Ricinus communis]|uniref:Molybdopterin cofactor synthesis protein A, putative n=1 Tax=Ricinus communis TaxID=3988 RepID=B9TDH5_RICCO|nr:molybdopterin cofactor synthesis protein A, putative [Ricinus communis]
MANITGRDCLPVVLQGLHAAKEAGLAPVKINMVAMRGVNDAEIDAMAAFCIEQEFMLRLIEVMPMGETGQNSSYLNLAPVQTRLAEQFKLKPQALELGGGPARYWTTEDGKASIGYITPMSQHFCATCNRVRLSVDGTLYLCLGQEQQYPLRPLLRGGATDAELEQAIREAIELKPREHDFNRQPEKIIRFISIETHLVRELAKAVDPHRRAAAEFSGGGPAGHRLDAAAVLAAGGQRRRHQRGRQLAHGKLQAGDAGRSPVGRFRAGRGGGGCKGPDTAHRRHAGAAAAGRPATAAVPAADIGHPRRVRRSAARVARGAGATGGKTAGDRDAGRHAGLGILRRATDGGALCVPRRPSGATHRARQRAAHLLAARFAIDAARPRAGGHGQHHLSAVRHGGGAGDAIAGWSGTHARAGFQRAPAGQQQRRIRHAGARLQPDGRQAARLLRQPGTARADQDRRAGTAEQGTGPALRQFGFSAAAAVGRVHV